MAQKVFPPNNALSFLKADLGFYESTLDPALESYLLGLLSTAGERCRRAGIRLMPGNADDDQLKAMYAAWLYRNRITGQGMPEMLKCEIRNRQVNSATVANT